MAVDRLLGDHGGFLCQTQRPHIVLMLTTPQRIWVSNITTCWKLGGVVFWITQIHNVLRYIFFCSLEVSDAPASRPQQWSVVSTPATL